MLAISVDNSKGNSFYNDTLNNFYFRKEKSMFWILLYLTFTIHTMHMAEELFYINDEKHTFEFYPYRASSYRYLSINLIFIINFLSIFVKNNYAHIYGNIYFRQHPIELQTEVLIYDNVWTIVGNIEKKKYFDLQDAQGLPYQPRNAWQFKA